MARASCPLAVGRHGWGAYPSLPRRSVDFAQSDVAPALKPAALVRGDRRLESRRTFISIMARASCPLAVGRNGWGCLRWDDSSPRPRVTRHSLLVNHTGTRLLFDAELCRRHHCRRSGGLQHVPNTFDDVGQEERFCEKAVPLWP